MPEDARKGLALLVASPKGASGEEGGGSDPAAESVADELFDALKSDSRTALRDAVSSLVRIIRSGG